MTSILYTVNSVERLKQLLGLIVLVIYFIFSPQRSPKCSLKGTSVVLKIQLCTLNEGLQNTSITNVTFEDTIKLTSQSAFYCQRQHSVYTEEPFFSWLTSTQSLLPSVIAAKAKHGYLCHYKMGKCPSTVPHPYHRHREQSGRSGCGAQLYDPL